MRAAPALVLVVLAGGVVTACGGDGDAASTSPPPSAGRRASDRSETRTQAPTQPRTPTSAPVTTATQPPATTRTEPENQSGGAGDERGARVPAQFTYRDGRLSPPLITVPAMFRIAVTIALPDGRRHRIAIGEVKVEASAGKLSTTLPGLRKGRSVSIRIDGRVGGRIVSGLRPGP